MFHSKIKESSIIKYKDISKSFDLKDYNYDEIIHTNINFLIKSKMINRIFVFSNYELKAFISKKLSIIRTKINTKKFMYEEHYRCIAL